MSCGRLSFLAVSREISSLFRRTVRTSHATGNRERWNWIWNGDRTVVSVEMQSNSKSINLETDAERAVLVDAIEITIEENCGRLLEMNGGKFKKENCGKLLKMNGGKFKKGGRL